MEVIQKIKKAFGFDGVKVYLEAPGTISRNGGTISGMVKIKSGSDRHIFEIDVYLEELITTGSGKNEQMHNFDLGDWRDETEFDIKAGETLEVPFTLNYSLAAPGSGHVPAVVYREEPGGTGDMALPVKSGFFLNAVIDVEGDAFDLNTSRELTLA